MNHIPLRCPLGTCRRCDALDRIEREARCPSIGHNPERVTGGNWVEYLISAAILLGCYGLYRWMMS